ncbi:hypothetical protein SDC9_140568 [bioreactor metagenome]|uniref:Uncharacterized protein n=1 Tax=bioreactor metagenome TaxID=1076179 RepID=A0A645DVR8_9ZZZZ
MDLTGLAVLGVRRARGAGWPGWQPRRQRIQAGALGFFGPACLGYHVDAVACLAFHTGRFSDRAGVMPFFDFRHGGQVHHGKGENHLADAIGVVSSQVLIHTR